MLTAIVLIDTDPARIPEVASEVADLKGVSEVYSVTGKADLVAMVRVHEHDQLADVIADQFETLHAESRQSGRVMCIACHPYVTGQPHRIGAFERALGEIVGREGVWMATGAEIAAWYRQHHLDPVRRWLASRSGAWSAVRAWV